MNRHDILNILIGTRKFKSYLEVGVRDHECFNRIEVNFKESIDIDPNANPTYAMSSDEFWRTTKNRYDVIFIDALHNGDQVYRDIIGALNHVTRRDSIIMCHDCNPWNYGVASHTCWDESTNTDGAWVGDTWAGFTYFRLHSEYRCFVVDDDCGCGIIDLSKKRSRVAIPENIKKLYDSIGPQDVNYLSYTLLDEHRQELLGLISVDEFLSEYASDRLI